MQWLSNETTSGVRALAPEFGLTLSVTEAVDGWWNWHAVYEGAQWSPDARWYPTRIDAQEAAEEWAATLAERHLGFFRQQSHQQLLAA